MSSKQEHPLEINTTQSSSEIYESSNKIEDHDNLGSGCSTRSVNNDLSSSMQDHYSEGEQSADGGVDKRTQGVDIAHGSHMQAVKDQEHLSEGRTQDIDHGSYMEAVEDQDHHKEGVHSSQNPSDGDVDIDHGSQTQAVKDQDHYHSEGVQSLQNPSDGPTQGAGIDHGSYAEAVKDQDHRSEGVQQNPSNGQTEGEDIDHNSYTQAAKDQDHRSESVPPIGRPTEPRKLARAASDGAAAEISNEFTNKIRHFRNCSTVPPELAGKLPLPTSQGEHNSGNIKWPTVPVIAAGRIKHSRSRSNIKEVFDPNKVDIDTKAPIDSVKSAVSKFGGIVDWKAHKVQTVERTKVIDEEIEKVREEIPLYKEQAEIAEQSKVEMLKELENTKQLIEELKLSLEKSETEESEAHQDSHVAKLRLEEIETGVGHEASVANKTELEMAINRHQTAISDLKSIKEELASLQKEYAALLIEKDAAVKKEEEAVCASKEMERTVETLTVELVSTKEALESSNSAHLEAEEHRIYALLAKDQDLYTLDKEMEEAQENLVNLNQQIESAKELKSKLNTTSSRVADLKAKLETYIDPKIIVDGKETSGGDKTNIGIQAVTFATNIELSDLLQLIDKTTDEVNCLKMASTSLKAELEKEQSELVLLRQREGMTSIAVASLEAELEKIKAEIDVVQKREKEAREKMEDLPRQLLHASTEAEEAKSEAELARQEMKMAKEEAETAKAEAKTIESRLLAVGKEIDATRALERLALAAIKAFQESESTKTTNDEDLNDKVALTLEEYYELTKNAHEAEEQANTKVGEAISKFEAAEEAELKSRKQLEDILREVDERKEALRTAQEKAEKATEERLGVEEELRKSRSGETGQGPIDSPTKSGEEGQDQAHPVDENQTTDGDGTGPAHEESSPNDDNENSTKVGGLGHSNTTKKKKKSLFPKFFMFFSKKHWKSSSKS